MMNTNNKTRRIVGPKPKIRLSRNDGPVSGFLASIVTLCCCSSWESCWWSANDGTWVEKSVASALELAGYFTAALNVPWIASEVEVISVTLLLLTWFRKVGLYGI